MTLKQKREIVRRFKAGDVLLVISRNVAYRSCGVFAVRCDRLGQCARSSTGSESGARTPGIPVRVRSGALISS